MEAVLKLYPEQVKEIIKRHFESTTNLKGIDLKVVALAIDKAGESFEYLNFEVTETKRSLSDFIHPSILSEPSVKL